MQGMRLVLRLTRGSTAKKSLLLALAERWLDLADAQDTRAKAGHGFRKIAADGLRRVSQKHQNGE